MALCFMLLLHAKDILCHFALHFFIDLMLLLQGMGTQLPMPIWKFCSLITQMVLLMSNKVSSRSKIIGIRMPKTASSKLPLCLGFRLLCLGFRLLCRLFRLCRFLHFFDFFLLSLGISFVMVVILTFDINNQPVFCGCCCLLSWDNKASYTALVKEGFSSAMLHSCFYDLFS